MPSKPSRVVSASNHRHVTVFPRTSKTKRLPWTRLSVILNAFCSIRTDSALSTLEISRNDSALYKCSLIIIIIIIIYSTSNACSDDDDDDYDDSKQQCVVMIHVPCTYW